MKKIFTVLSLLVLTTFTNQAGASCSDVVREKIDSRNDAVLIGVGSAWFTLGAGAVFAGVYYLIGVGSAQSMLKLLDQARSHGGRKIQNLYRQYRNKNSNPVSFDTFCDQIVKGDNDMSFCGGNSMPSKSVILDRFTLDATL